MSDLGTVFLTAGLGGLVGGFAKNLLNVLFELFATARKERRFAQDDFSILVGQVEEFSIVYWGLPGDEEGQIERAGRVSGQLHHCNEMLELAFKENSSSKKEAEMLLVSFRKVVSGEGFGTRERRAESERTALIIVAGSRLKSAIRKERFTLL